MKYSDLLIYLGNQLRDTRAWPENASGTKLAEQLRYLFGAVLVVGRQAPLRVLRTESSSAFVTAGISLTDFGDLYRGPLPDDLFFIRPDYGVHEFVFSGSKIRRPEESVSMQVLRSGSSSFLYTSHLMFHIDAGAAMLYTNMDISSEITYLPAFTEPTTENYTETDVPLPQPYDEQAIQLALQHIESILTGNTGIAAVHSALAEFYGEPATADPEPET